MKLERAENYSCPKCGHNVGTIITLTDAKILMCEKCSNRETIEQWEASLRCPKCGSTAITTGARGIDGFWGAIGASKTVNRCGNCGLMFKPRG